MSNIPYKIVRHWDGFAVVHGTHNNMFAYKKTFIGCLRLAICWKKRGFCDKSDLIQMINRSKNIER